MHLGSACTLEKLYQLCTSCTAYDGVVNEHHALSLYRMADGIELYLNLILAHVLSGSDKGSSYVFILNVGARGETPELFEESRQFIESLDISRLHVFTYSERPGTRALKIEYAVDPREKHRRTRIMLDLSERKLQKFTQRFIGTTRQVLLEHSRAGKPMSGFTDNYIKVEVARQPQLDNTLAQVMLNEIINNGEEVKGEIIS